MLKNFSLVFKVSRERFPVISKTIMFNVAEEGSHQSMESQTGCYGMKLSTAFRRSFAA